MIEDRKLAVLRAIVEDYVATQEPVGSKSLVERAGAPRGLAALQSEQGARSTFLVSSGRAALTILLEALRRRSERREVVIPAYTCFSVASAIARAGLTIRLCDVDPVTLDLRRPVT